MTYNLLKNKNYLAYPNHGTQIKLDAAAPHDRIDRVDKMLEELKTKSPEKIKGVILDHFHWHRIVMDEGHEVIEDEFTTGMLSYIFNLLKILFFSLRISPKLLITLTYYIIDVIYYLQRTYAWYMSGTPFTNMWVSWK